MLSINSMDEHEYKTLLNTFIAQACIWFKENINKYKPAKPLETLEDVLDQNDVENAFLKDFKKYMRNETI